MRVWQPGSHLVSQRNVKVEDWSWAQTKRRLSTLYRLYLQLLMLIEMTPRGYTDQGYLDHVNTEAPKRIAAASRSPLNISIDHSPRTARSGMAGFLMIEDSTACVTRFTSGWGSAR